jgi:hypothetical protein
MPWQDLPDRLARAVQYVVGRQCQSGGFCVYRNDYLEEPNLSDTWHALAALKLLDADIPRLQAVDSWLDSFCFTSLHHDALYDWLLAKRLTHVNWCPDAQTVDRIAALPLVPPRQADSYRGALQSLLRTVRLKAAVSAPCRAPGVLAWLHGLRHLNHGASTNLMDTAAVLELLAALGEPNESDEIRAFVDALQSPYMGFNNTLDSRYCRLDTMLAGMQCCVRLGLAVRFQQVIRFIAFAAQRQDGAFADVPGALPTLESHHTALVLLSMLIPLHCGTDAAKATPSAGLHGS